MSFAASRKFSPLATGFERRRLAALILNVTQRPLEFGLHLAARKTIKLLCGPVPALFLTDADAAGVDDGRGEMLYQNHCIACHITQVHWREQRLAKDWKALRAQVRRWERNTGLSWSDEDVEAVSRYLNRRDYGYPDPPRNTTISLLRRHHSTDHFFKRGP